MWFNFGAIYFRDAAKVYCILIFCMFLGVKLFELNELAYHVAYKHTKSNNTSEFETESKYTSACTAHEVAREFPREFETNFNAIHPHTQVFDKKYNPECWHIQKTLDEQLWIMLYICYDEPTLDRVHSCISTHSMKILQEIKVKYWSLYGIDGVLKYEDKIFDDLQLKNGILDLLSNIQFKCTDKMLLGELYKDSTKDTVFGCLQSNSVLMLKQVRDIYIQELPVGSPGRI